MADAPPASGQGAGDEADEVPDKNTCSEPDPRDEKFEEIEQCTKSIEANPIDVRSLLRRAKLYEETDKLDEALADYTKVLELDPSNREARLAAQKLPGEINDRNEKLKAEMLGKLKELGNMVLRPFGLSTDNFQLQQDPNTGGYSVNFTK